MSVQNCAIVILGASGDLTRRKLVPVLYALYVQGKIDDSNVIIGSGRSSYTDEQFRKRFDVSGRFAAHLFYRRYTAGLREYIRSKGNFEKVIFFLSLPPSTYAHTVKELAAEGFCGEISLIIEKPFGYDYNSARELNRKLTACFKESQIFRIDHYLAKEAVQNILVFRFANSIFYPVWNSRYVESIQINALESTGITERGAYFDKAGIIRDMVQNHLLQLLCLLTMEAPVSLDPEDIRRQKTNVLRSITIDEIRRFQYEGYQEEKGVAENSTTETYAELKLTIDNYRWYRTPVYIRTGKAVHRHGTEIGIRFKPLPRLLFNETGAIPPNHIIFKIQPAEGIIFDVSSKVPGTDDEIAGTHMNFCYRDSFAGESPEAYQRLLYDALRGDHTLFVSAEETETSWKLFEGLLDKGDLKYYKPGTLPGSDFPVDWIDFDKYAPLCL